MTKIQKFSLFLKGILRIVKVFNPSEIRGYEMFLYIWSIAPMYPYERVLYKPYKRENIMTSVNTSSQTQQIFKQGLQTVKQLKTGDMQQMGNSIFDQGVGTLTDQLGLSPEAKAAVDGAIDIVKTVLMGMYNKAQLEAEDSQMINEINQQVNNQTQLSEAVNRESENIKNEAKSQADATQSDMGSAVDEGQAQLDAAADRSAEINTQTDEAKENIQKNNEEIQKQDQVIKDLKQQKADVDTQFQQRMAELKANPQDPNGNQGDINADPQLQNLMAKRTSLIGQIGTAFTQMLGFQTSNIELQSNIEGLQAEKQNLADESMEISAELATQVDEMSGAFTDIYNNASGAVNELSGMLQGQFPQFDKITCIKLACMVAKSAICGTNSGLLAAAAAELGVGSVVSFGATAAKAAQCTEASINEGGRAAKLALQNSVQKIAVDQAKVFTNQIVNNILSGISPELQQAFGEFKEFYNEGISLMADSGANISGGESEVTNADLNTDEVAASSDEILNNEVPELLAVGDQIIEDNRENSEQDPLSMGSGGTSLA